MRRHILLTKTLASTQNHADHQSGYPGINMNYGATGKVYRSPFGDQTTSPDHVPNR